MKLHGTGGGLAGCEAAARFHNEETTMVEALARNWGWIVLRGIAAIMFGVLALVKPEIALTTLVLLFGAYALVDGCALVGAAIANRKGEQRWGALLVAGLIGIAVGIVTFFVPGLTAVALLAIIAAWAIVMGIAEVVAAIELRKVIDDEWLMIITGIVSVAFGVFLIARPAAGALAVVLWIGAFAALSGILQIGFALKLRSWGQTVSTSVPTGQRRAAV
jgi:uncharacterized membrane protein HdeD (DUF308 family)